MNSKLELGLEFDTHLAFLLLSLSQDINKNRSIDAALAYEEKFFHDNPVLFAFPFVLCLPLRK